MTAESMFDRLVGRQPSDKERQLLFRLQKELKLQDDDAVWSILIGSQVVTDLLQKIPAEVQKAAEAAAKSAALRTQEIYTKHVAAAADMRTFTTQFRNQMMRVTFVIWAIVAVGCVVTDWLTQRYADDAIYRASMDAAAVAEKQLASAWDFALTSTVRELLPRGYAGVADQVAALAQIERTQPGSFAAIAKLPLGDIARTEVKQPGSIAFAISPAGQFYMRMYAQNNKQLCNEKRVERVGGGVVPGPKVITCVNVDPDEVPGAWDQ